MGPNGSQNCKMLLLPQIAPEFSETLPEFLSRNILTKLLFRIFEILRFWILTIFFSFSLTWDPMGAIIAKCYSFHKSRPNLFKFFLNFCLQYPHRVAFQIFEILYFSNFMKLWNLTWESMGNHKMWNILKTADRRAKRMKIWDSQS